MAKFCKYCGAKLEDNEVCFCEKAVNERTGVSAAPARVENFDVKENLNGFLEVLKVAFKSRKKAYGISSYISSAIFAVLGFLITAFAIKIPFSALSSKSYGYIDVSLGKCFLMSLIITLVTVAVHTIIKYVESMIKTKSFGITPQIVSVGCINLFYYSIMLFVCALCVLISAEFGAFLFLITMLLMILDIAGEIGVSGNNIRYLVTVVITTIIVAIVVAIIWNAIYNISGLAGAVGTVSSFF